MFCFCKTILARMNSLIVFHLSVVLHMGGGVGLNQRKKVLQFHVQSPEDKVDCCLFAAAVVLVSAIFIQQIGSSAVMQHRTTHCCIQLWSNSSLSHLLFFFYSAASTERRCEQTVPPCSDSNKLRLRFVCFCSFWIKHFL